MEKLKNVTGRWRGIYSYNAVNGLPHPLPVAFTLNLKQGWFGRFTGSVADSEVGGVPGVGSIQGALSFPRIQFLKRMPICFITAPDGRIVSLRDYLEEVGHSYDREFPHPAILYRGTCTSLTEAEGTWIVREHEMPLGDGRAVKMLGGTGSWRMEFAGV